jgi:biopolymer transport protein ExbB/TolQ
MNLFAVFTSGDYLLISVFAIMLLFSVFNWAVIMSKFILLKKVNLQETCDVDVSTADKLESFLSIFQNSLEKGLGTLATSASMVPFIGLLGTVIGIAKALKDISIQGSANIAVVAGPIGEALGSTAFGLIVAIPAGIFYNYFTNKINEMVLLKRHILINKK